jgi:hypothetical protein
VKQADLLAVKTKVSQALERLGPLGTAGRLADERVFLAVHDDHRQSRDHCLAVDRGDIQSGPHEHVGLELAVGIRDGARSIPNL